MDPLEVQMPSPIERGDAVIEIVPSSHGCHVLL